jgi:hypothetical protein
MYERLSWVSAVIHLPMALPMAAGLTAIAFAGCHGPVNPDRNGIPSGDPEIVAQPASQVVRPMEPARFSVVAKGETPLSFQWQKNGTNITGATTAEYTTPGARPEDGGSIFKVVVSNNKGAVASRTAMLSVSLGTQRAYATSFPLAENPISEARNWINGREVGLDWENVQTTTNLAYGTRLSSKYADPTAVLPGVWSSDQQAQAIVQIDSDLPACCHEVELRLRTTITAHSITGYEINCSVSSSSPYVEIVRWNGPLSSFAYLNSRRDVSCADGDILKATMNGSTITVYKNGREVLRGEDKTFSSGSPGIGFYDYKDSDWKKFGFSSFAAADSAGNTHTGNK